MAYALSSPLTSVKITIDSDSGELRNGEVYDRMYYLTNKIVVPEGYKALISIESMYFKQPSLFCKEYYDGSITISRGG